MLATPSVSDATGLLKTKLFPALLLVCNIGSAVTYAVAGDFRRAVYWAASSMCIAAITF